MCEVYPKSRKVIYHVRGSQAKIFDTITLDGWDEIPAGLYLYKSGYGFGRKGTVLLSAIKKYVAKHTPATLVISRTGAKGIRGSTVKTITLPYADVHDLLVRLGRINEDSNNELRATCASFLKTKLPRTVETGAVGDDYTGGEIASVLRRKKVAEKLNDEDLGARRELFPKIFAAPAKGKTAAVKAQRSALITSTKRVTDRIFLDEVIREFQSKLGKANASWLRDRMRFCPLLASRRF